MIQLAEDIGSWDTRVIPLSKKHKQYLIEVASTEKIDFAVLDENQLKEFDENDSDDDLSIEWNENMRTLDFEFTSPSPDKRYYLVIWNAYSKKDAVVAYKITPTN